MQLALRTKTWCDFVLYTGKGMIIDRVMFDPEHWANIQKFAIDFYFQNMLPKLVEKFF